jgi:predicted Rossmann fold flavoprotein
MSNHFDLVVVGGGAAGFFTAINCAENHPGMRIAILERGQEVLGKVRISGGGRCNVTHACFEPNALVKNYPRGERELRGPFHQFCSGDTVEWFAQHDVELKTEADGRMFPLSNTSDTIVQCFTQTAKKLGIQVLLGQSVQEILPKEKGWKIHTVSGNFSGDQLLLATGSNPKIWEMLQSLGHQMVAPVASLFTFNCKDSRIANLMGVSTQAQIAVVGTKLQETGPLLITHWGMSGPAVLRLSAWGARLLAEKQYQFTVQINWLPEQTLEQTLGQLQRYRTELAKRAVQSKSPFELPNRLWESLTTAAGFQEQTKWADSTKIQLQQLAEQLCNCQFKVNGKSTFKEEFVTAGGIDLKEIQFKTMQSKRYPSLYFAGEIVDVDAITGGFNFQNAWTSGFIAAKAIVENLAV